MKNKQQQRAEAIESAAKQKGFLRDGGYIISFWDLASELNNCWDAHLFISKRYASGKYPFAKAGLTNPNWWAVEQVYIHLFRRMINWTITRMRNAQVVQDSPTYYRVTKP